MKRQVFKHKTTRKNIGKKGLKRLLFLGILVLAIAALVAGYIWLKGNAKEGVITPTNNQNIATATPSPSLIVSPSPTPSVPSVTPTIFESAWPVQLTYEQADSVTVVVNKKHQLPAGYAPNGGALRDITQNAINQLFNDATTAGYSLKIISGYRSYGNQQSTYNGWVSQYGQEYADTISARAGHSEHQTGLAVDVGDTSRGDCNLEICFGDLESGKWLAANAPKYGFIIRYPSGKESITGYSYEPWHIRYIGEIAQAVTNSGKTLDEYFDVPAGDYQ